MRVDHNKSVQIVRADQGALLPPPIIPGHHDMLVSQNTDGEFYQDPELAERVNPLLSEDKALRALSIASRAHGAIKNAKNIVNGVVPFDDDILPVSLRALAAGETLERMADIVPKLHFAHSIGMEAEIQASYDPVTKEKIDGTLRVDVVDYYHRRELNRRYGNFKQRYEGRKGSKAREARRAQIEMEVQRLRTGALAVAGS